MRKGKIVYVEHSGTISIGYKEEWSSEDTYIIEPQGSFIKTEFTLDSLRHAIMADIPKEYDGHRVIYRVEWDFEEGIEGHILREKLTFERLEPITTEFWMRK